MSSTLDLDPVPTAESTAALALRSGGGGVSLSRRYLVAAAAFTYVGLAVWQVVTKRDDWPLSNYSMYSRKQGPVTDRQVLLGVGDDGEFRLSGGQLPAGVGGARLRHLNKKLERNKKRRDRFVALVQRHYARRRQPDWPELQALRSYTESWRIRAGLKGIDKPSRTLTSFMYFPPPTLLAAREAEESAREPQAPVPRPDGDVVLEADASWCSAGCIEVEDRYAALGRAVELGSAAGGELAELTLDGVPSGTWSIFVRMKVPSKGRDNLSILVDGARPKNAKAGIGNYSGVLPTRSWVWGSTQPGLPALSLQLKGEKERRIVLRANSPGVRIDQVWLSRQRRELPTFNQPLGP